MLKSNMHCAQNGFVKAILVNIQAFSICKPEITKYESWLGVALPICDWSSGNNLMCAEASTTVL